MSGLWFDVVKPKPWSQRKPREGRQFMVTQKYDGWHLVIARDEASSCCALTKGKYGDVIDLLGNEYGWMNQLILSLPCKSAVVGELVVTGMPASEVSHALATLRAAADTPLLAPPELEFKPFAVPWWGGEWFGDREDLITPVGCCNDYTLVTEGVDDLSDEALRARVQPGNEGLVLKERHYVQGTWWKWKLEETADCVVTGIVEGNGRLLGQVGAVRVSCYDESGRLVEIGRAGGFTEDERDDLSEDCIGRVCEVTYQYIGAGGRLRHPRFKRWRDDKKPEECVMSWK